MKKISISDLKLVADVRDASGKPVNILKENMAVVSSNAKAKRDDPNTHIKELVAEVKKLSTRADDNMLASVKVMEDALSGLKDAISNGVVVNVQNKKKNWKFDVTGPDGKLKYSIEAMEI